MGQSLLNDVELLLKEHYSAATDVQGFDVFQEQDDEEFEEDLGYEEDEGYEDYMDVDEMTREVDAAVASAAASNKVKTPYRPSLMSIPLDESSSDDDEY